MAKFEITIYTKEVREKVEAGEHHRDLTDEWADFQYVEIEADTEQQARARAEDRYPNARGYVIDDIRKTDGGFE